MSNVNQEASKTAPTHEPVLSPPDKFFVELALLAKAGGWSKERLKHIEDIAVANWLAVEKTAQIESQQNLQTLGVFMTNTKQSLQSLNDSAVKGPYARGYMGRYGIIRERVEQWFWNFGLTIIFGLILAKILPNNKITATANANNPFASTEPVEQPTRRRPQAAA
jgi:hypothetical protein